VADRLEDDLCERFRGNWRLVRLRGEHHHVFVDGNTEGQGDLLRDPWTSPARVPLFHVDDRGDGVLAGSLGARFHGHLGREEPPIFPLGQRSMKAQQGGGFEDDRGTDHPARLHEERTQAGDNTIREPKIGRPFSRPIEDQQLVLDEHGFGHRGTRAAGTGQSGDRRQQMQKKNGEIALAPIVSRSRNPKETLTDLAIRHAQADER
jgi:hypothetical protein